MIIGMDLGTTNSGMAVYDGQRVRLLPLDATSPDPGVMRSALYLNSDQKATAGQAAINLYLEQNLGRPVRMERVWVGELEAVYAEMFYVRDIYDWRDALSPGRLLLSFKTGLHSVDYQGTSAGSLFFSLEDILSLYLYITRLRAERLLGKELRQVVLGRPVKYSLVPKEDAIAQERFIEAALRAGYEEVYLEHEPVAAACHFEATTDREQNVLVFDFGGGTLDLTVMHVGHPARRRVLASGGLPIAGDAFDQALARARMPKHFGEGGTLVLDHRLTPMPAWIYDTFTDWQSLLLLQTPENLRLLREMAQTARQPDQLQALISLVSTNYSLKLFSAVEEAKRNLSRTEETVIRLEGPGFDIREPVTRREFEEIIQADIRAVDQLVEDTVRASGLDVGQIDAVIRTGGSSQIPAFQQLLFRRFGPERVRGVDVFSSVASGLGIIAHRIETGEMAAAPFTRGQGKYVRQTFARPEIPPANMSLLMQRIRALEVPAVAPGGDPAGLALLWLNPEGQVVAAQVPASFAASPRVASLQAVFAGAPPSPVAVTLGALDDRMLLLTSRYRFALLSPREILAGQATGAAAASLLRLDPQEQIVVMQPWEALCGHTRLILVTRLGLAFWYDLRRLAVLIEGPVPFRLSLAGVGWPAAVLGAETEDDLTVLTTWGRAARAPVRSLSVEETAIMHFARGSPERIACAQTTRPVDQILVVTRQGTARRVSTAAIPTPSGAKPAGKSPFGNEEVCGLAVLRPYKETKVWAVTQARLVPVSPYRVPQDEELGRKSHPCPGLEPGETVSALVTSST
jgi:hypothetical chaperone protein